MTRPAALTIGPPSWPISGLKESLISLSGDEYADALGSSAALGIVGGNMAWPLVAVGILMGLAMILIEVRSPMLFAVGMYLPLETTFAIFLGGVIRWATDKLRDRRGFNDAQKARVDNAGVLTASGFIAGEALCGLVVAGIVGSGHRMPQVFTQPYWIAGLIAFAVLVAVMIKVPLANAGRPEDPAPPTAIM